MDFSKEYPVLSEIYFSPEHIGDWPHNCVLFRFVPFHKQRASFTKFYFAEDCRYFVLSISRNRCFLSLHCRPNLVNNPLMQCLGNVVFKG
jgi:hypothetical protein